MDNQRDTSCKNSRPDCSEAVELDVYGGERESDELLSHNTQKSNSRRAANLIKSSQDRKKKIFRCLFLLPLILLLCTVVLALHHSISRNLYNGDTSQEAQADRVVAPGVNADIGMISIFYGNGSRHGVVGVKNTTEAYEKSISLMARYTRKWGYGLWMSRDILLRGPDHRIVLPNGRMGGATTDLWSKEALVLSVLLNEIRKPESSRLKWLFFLDADAAIVNHNVPLSTFLPPDTDFGRGQSLLCAMDRWNTLNSGAFFVRVSEDGVRLMTTLLAYPYVLDSKNRAIANGEQSALASLLINEQLRDKIALVPSFWFNANIFAWYHLNGETKKNYNFGDLLIHFMSNDKTGWEEFLDSATQWNNISLAQPLSETRYVKGGNTVSQYWSEWESMQRQKKFDILTEASKNQD